MASQAISTTETATRFNDFHALRLYVSMLWLLILWKHVNCDDVHGLDYFVFLGLDRRFGELPAFHRRARP